MAKLSKNAGIVLSRYLTKDTEGTLTETPEQLLKRVANNIAKEDLKYSSSYRETKKTEKEFFEVMQNLEFLPNLPTLANAGRKLQQLAACFVVPVPDNTEGIFQAVKELALIQRTGGGTGFSFSQLRPDGSHVSKTGGIASGPASFVKVFDAATTAIKEGGIRRGANMGVLRVDHPDIERFISLKEKGGLSSFNISIALTDKFMDAVKKNKEFELEFGGKVYKTLKARELFRLLSKRAWLNGDPGVIFIDRINKSNPTPKFGEIETTNPCGEQPLLPYESCILGSINISKFVKKKKIDTKRLSKTIKTAVHFLDNSIDASSYPIHELETVVQGNRKIGLGLMGFADALIEAGITYDSKEAERFAQKIMRILKEESTKASAELAKKRGPFPNINESIYKNKKLRNSTLTTIAPTGTISIIANCSEGIEPLFSPIFHRHTTYGKLEEIDRPFQKLIKKLNIDEKTLSQIEAEGTLKNSNLPEKIKKLFRTAHDISPEWHIRLQAAFQKFTDNAVSKTVNLPNSATIEDVENAFLLAYKLGCKGLTVYRYKSRKEQVLEFCTSCTTKN